MKESAKLYISSWIILFTTNCILGSILDIPFYAIFIAMLGFGVTMLLSNLATHTKEEKE